MNIEKKLRRAFRRATPNVLGTLPAQEPTVKRRKRLSDQAIQFIATAASIAILIGVAFCGFAYYRDHFPGPIIHSGTAGTTNVPGTTDTPTQPSESQPTETTVPPTTDPLPTDPLPTDPPPTDPPPTEPVYDMEWLEYNKHPDTYLSFRFSKDSEYVDYPGKAYDTSSMKDGAFYAVDDGEVYLITERYVKDWFVTSEHIYYVIKDEATKVYRTDHYGQDETVIFESDYGDISWIQYFGTNENGKLILSEDQKRIIMYDIPSDTVEVLMEAHKIGQFHYYPYSICYDDVVEHISEENLGPTIYWRGHIAESADYGIYYYFIETGEHWDITAWEPVPVPPEPLEVSDWQLDVETLDHDTYFSEERYYINWFANDLEWLKERDDGTYFFKAALTDTGIVISCEALPGIYTVPDSQKYAGGSLLATDGCSAWVYWAEQVLRVDMASGASEIIMEMKGLELISVQDNAVAYYVLYDNAQNLTIGQLYLPDGHHKVLHQQQIDTYIIGCDWLKYSNGTFSVAMYNPEMIEVIRQELADPNSPYKHNDLYDYSEIWDQEDALEKLLKSYMWLDYFQDEIGIRAYLKIYCDLSSGKVTQKTGIIDTCMYGSGYPHDHFNPEITTDTEPIASISDWRELNLAPWNGDNSEGEYGRYRIVVDTLSQGTLCWISGGKAQIVLDTPVVTVREADGFFICVTTDQRILQVSLDGSCVRELYKATIGKIDEISIAGTHVFFTDGDTIMELDLENDRIRSVLQHPHLLETYFMGSEYDSEGENILYFAIRHGMFYEQYLVNLETGEIEETSFL